MTSTTARIRAWGPRSRRAIIALLASVGLILGGVVGISAGGTSYPSQSTPTDVFLDGKEVLDGDCIILDSVTYVPLRKFCNLFDNCKFSWNGKTNTATVTTDTLTMTAQTGAIYITANGHYYYTVGKVLNLDGSLYVPIRPLVRAFDSELSWNAKARRVEISTKNRDSMSVSRAVYNEDDLYWLSRIISAEAKGESLLGQIAVGNVVLNRVRSESYPDSIWGVIFDRKHGTQFSPVAFGTIYQKPTESAIVAAKICLEGYTLSDSILFFMNPRIATNNWISRNRPYEFTIGNHDFYS